MKRVSESLLTTAFAALIGISVAAAGPQQTPPTQTPPPTQQPTMPTPQQPPATTPRPSQTPTAGDEQTVVVSGCVERGAVRGAMSGTSTSGSAAGAAGTAQSSQASSAFKITKAQITGAGSMSGTAAPAARPNPTSDARASTEREFALMPRTGVDLSAHVNHQMEVTGTVNRAQWSEAMTTMGRGAMDTSTGRATGNPGTPPSSTTSPNPPSSSMASQATAPTGPVIQVTSVKMVASTCQ